MKLTVIALTLLISSPTQAAELSNSALLRSETILNLHCRGDYPSAAQAMACKQRDAVTAKLFARGYCLVGEVTADQRWEHGPACKR